MVVGPEAIARRLRQARRTGEILRALARHGLAEFVERTGLAALLESGETLESTAAGPISQAARLRLVLEDLGSTFVKVGQILSTRPDLIPPEFVEELSKLQSDAPRISWDEVASRLDASFPDGWQDEVFESIDREPLAAASMAQAHRARLVGGQPVVLKILRPGIEGKIAGDMAVLRDLARLVEASFDELGFSPVDAIAELSVQLERELDLRREGRSVDRLRNAFAGDDGVHFPEVHWAATTSTVLALEEIRGLQLSNVGPDDLSVEDRRRALANGTRAVFKMCLEDGFFHADPHQGNLFVLDGGRVCFIDCGMTGYVDTRTREQLGRLVRAVLGADLDETIRIAIELADADPALEDDRGFRADAWEMISRFEAGSFESLDIGALLQAFFDVLRRRGLRIPADLVYLIKALTTIEGVARRMDPEFDVIGEVRGLVTRIFLRQYGVEALKERVLRSLGGYVELVEDLPPDMRRIYREFRRRGFAVRLQHEGIEDLRHEILQVGRILAIGMIVSATLISSALLILSESASDEPGLFAWLGRITWVSAFALVFALAAGTLRRKA